MDSMQLLLLFARAEVIAADESARPWAPVVLPRERRHRWRGVRGAMARALRWAADVVAPAPVCDVGLAL